MQIRFTAENTAGLLQALPLLLLGSDLELVVNSPLLGGLIVILICV